MTEKDYQMIARVIKRVRKDNCIIPQELFSQDALSDAALQIAFNEAMKSCAYKAAFDTLTCSLATEFEKDNAKFNKKKFLLSCGDIKE